MPNRNYLAPEPEMFDEDTSLFAGHTFLGQDRFFFDPDQLALAPKRAASGWGHARSEWGDLFRERVGEPTSLIFLSYLHTFQQTALEVMKSAALGSDARNYGISVAEAFRNATKEYPGISVDPEVMAGAPSIAGTRIPVYMVLDALENHGTVEGVLKSYPRLTAAQVKDAIGFSKGVVECPLGDEA